MRYRIDFHNLEESINYIDDKNDLVKESLNNLKSYQKNLQWQSSNRVLFNKKYDELTDNITRLIIKTNELMRMLKKKYRMFDDLYQQKIKKISEPDEEDLD